MKERLRKILFRKLEKTDKGIGRAIGRFPVWLRAGLVFLLDVAAAEMDKNPLARYLLFALGIFIALGALVQDKPKRTC